MKGDILFKTIIVVLILISIPQMVYAAFSFNSYLNNEINSIDITYSETKSIPIRVVSNNQWCDISCGFYIDRSNFYNFGVINAGKSKETTFTISSPNKGLEGDIKSIAIEVVCNQASSLICGSIEGTPKNTLLTITYHLTPAQKEARDYVNSNLPQLTNSLTGSDASIKKIEDKLSQLASNVKVTSIKNGVNNLRSKYSSFKNEANNIKSQFDNLDYILAKSSFRINLIQEVGGLTSEALSLEKELDQIIIVHNEMANKILLLGDLNNNIRTSLKILNEEDATTLEIENLISRFNSGNFDNYDSIKSDIDTLNSKWKDLEKNLMGKIESLKKEAAIILTKESEKLCKEEKICISITKIDTIEDVCSKLKELSTEVTKVNYKRENDFNDLKEDIIKFNDEAQKFNDKSNEINIRLKDKDLDISSCNSLIKEVNSKVKEGSLPNLTGLENNCLNIENQLEEENIESKGFLDKLFGFFSGIFGKRNEIKLINTLKISEQPKIISFSEEANQYIISKCKFDTTNLKENYQVSIAQVVERKIEGESIGGTKEREEQCCVFGECTTCCKDESCRNNPSTYPIIFVHGHAPFGFNTLDYSINSLSGFQQRLADSEKYLKADILLPTSNINAVKQGDWGKVNKPISTRVSYYVGVYDETGKTVGKENGQSIDVYSQRLSGIIDKVLHHTGKDKVIIITHSMGGLVSRNYVKNFGGANKVYKLITIGSPHHGIHGWLIGGLCGTLHLEKGKLPECQDMQFDSEFMKRLNSGDETGGVNTLSIIASCAINEEGEAHDEVVRVSSATINGAKNIIIEEACIGSTSSPLDVIIGGGNLHQTLTRNDKVYNEILKFLEN